MDGLCDKLDATCEKIAAIIAQTTKAELMIICTISSPIMDRYKMNSQSYTQHNLSQQEVHKVPVPFLCTSSIFLQLEQTEDCNLDSNSVGYKEPQGPHLVPPLLN